VGILLGQVYRKQPVFLDHDGSWREEWAISSKLLLEGIHAIL